MGLGIAIAGVDGVADPELGSAASVEVVEKLGEPVTFRLRYQMDVVDGDFPLLVDDRLAPGATISILVPVGETTECLVRGVVHAQQVHFEHGGAGSWLEVQGSDRLVEMDRESKSVAWDGTASDAAMSILGTYGFTPDVEETTTKYTEQTHLLVQRDSDLRFLRRVGRRYGYLLWITSDAMGEETAHFRRPPLDGGVAGEFAINVSPPSLASLDLSWDVERPTSVEGVQLDLSALSDINGATTSPLTTLGAEDLATITGDIRSVFLAAPADDVGDLSARSQGVLVEAGFFVRAQARTSLAQLGALMRAHTMVDMRGVGSRHSGKYLVSSVRHTIDATSHRMDLELMRNGWGA